MVAPVDALVGSVADHAILWKMTRASLYYMRDVVQISRGNGDLLTPLIFTAILDANMSMINRDPELQKIYGGQDISAPDELRRPVSINAVAQSLRLPFETVRRRVGGMVRSGRCVMDLRGVVVPRAAVTTPAYIAIQRARYDRSRQFYQELKAVGFLPADGPVDTWAPTASPLIRAANRAMSSYMLRAANDLIAMTGDPLSSLIVLELVLANTEALSDAEMQAWAQHPTRLATPLRLAALARRLNLSPETTRRHVVGLEARALCRRRDNGLIAVATPDVWPQLSHLFTANITNVHRLFAAFRQLDVLAAWETPDLFWPTAVAVA